jgi:small subunit ribosomal protein S6
MKRYDTFTILDPDLSEESRKPVIEKINDLILQKNGLLVEKDEWGARKLAYEIKKKTRGYYILFDYCGTGPLVSEIERSCRIDDRVLKYMTILTQDEVDIDQIKKEIEEKKAQRKAAAEEAAKAVEPVDSATVSETAEGVSDKAEITEIQNDAEERPNE